MADIPVELLERFPNLSQPGISILAILVEKIMEQAALDDARQADARQQVVDVLGAALLRAEERFVREHPDQETARALLQLPLYKVPGAADDIWAFYQDPGDRGLVILLSAALRRVPGVAIDQAAGIAADYEISVRKELGLYGILRGKSSEPGSTRIGEVVRSAIVFGNNNVVRVGGEGDEIIPHETRQRVLEAAIEKEVCVGIPASLFVWIRREESKSIITVVAEIDEDVVLDEDNIKNKTLEIEFPIRDGKVQAAVVRLKLAAPEFDPPLQDKRILVPPDGDSEVCTFIVSPRRAGRLLLTLEVLKEEVSLAARNLRTTAIEGQRAGAAPLTGVSIPTTMFVPVIQPGSVNVDVGGTVGGSALLEPDTQQRIDLERQAREKAESAKPTWQKTEAEPLAERARRAAQEQQQRAAPRPPRAQEPSQPLPSPPVAPVPPDSPQPMPQPSAGPQGCAPRGLLRAVAVIVAIIVIAACVLAVAALIQQGLR